MPASVQEGSLFSTTSPPLIVCRLFDKGHCYPCELICDCSFDFHFCKISWCWNPFKKKKTKPVWVKLNSPVWLFDSLLCSEFFSRTFVEDRCLFLAFPQAWEEVKSLSRARLFATPWTVACTKLLHPWDFLGKSTGVGCRFLLQGIFPTQGSTRSPTL